MLIRNQESGLVLPPAPGFGVNGVWPPPETEWLPLRWELFEQESSDLEAMVASVLFRLTQESISDDVGFKNFCTNPSIPDSTLKIGLSKSQFSFELSRGEANKAEVSKMEVSATRPSFFSRGTAQLSDARDMMLRIFSANKEIRQLAHSVRWRRKDPVTQLPPDATHEMTYTVTTGLSIEHSQALGESLGLNLGGKAPGFQAGLSYKLQEQFGLKLDITTTEETSTKLTLSNQSKDNYRVFALWQVDHQLSVSTLKAPVAINTSQDAQLEWRLCHQVEFTNANQPFITYAEIPH
jgi:hypothetical protein